MIQTSNGQGRFTAERVLRTRPKTYRAIVKLLASPGRKGFTDRQTSPCLRAYGARNQTARGCGNSRAKTEADFNLWECGRNRSRTHGRTGRKASLRDAGTTAGIATDKLLLLLGETGAGVPVQINVQVNAQALQDKFAEMVRKIEALGDSANSDSERPNS